MSEHKRTAFSMLITGRLEGLRDIGASARGSTEKAVSQTLKR